MSHVTYQLLERYVVFCLMQLNSKGCSKCLKEFYVDGKHNSAGFDPRKWKKRDITDHRQKALEYTNCRSRSEEEAFEQEHGMRYSVLLDLPYFNPIRMVVHGGPNA